MHKANLATEYNIQGSDSAFCVNLGGPPPHDHWYPADALKIVEWQPYKGKVDDNQFTSNMLAVAKRSPDINRELILSDARQHLGLIPSELYLGTPLYLVGFGFYFAAFD